MLVVNIAAALSIILLFLQGMRKISLSSPVVVGFGIVLLPAWEAYTFYILLDKLFGAIGLSGLSGAQTDPISDLLSYSAATLGSILLTLFLVSIPYLLFLVILIKFNVLPYRSSRNCPADERETVRKIACTRLCGYALAMLVLYLAITGYCMVGSFEGLVIGMTGLGFINGVGGLGVILVFFINPLVGLIAFAGIAAINAIIFIPLFIFLALLGILLTAAQVTALNAVIRTCRFTGRKVVGLTLLTLLPIVNIIILIYLLVCLNNKKTAALVG